MCVCACVCVCVCEQIQQKNYGSTTLLQITAIHYKIVKRVPSSQNRQGCIHHKIVKRVPLEIYTLHQHIHHKIVKRVPLEIYTLHQHIHHKIAKRVPFENYTLHQQALCCRPSGTHEIKWRPSRWQGLRIFCRVSRTGEVKHTHARTDARTHARTRANTYTHAHTGPHRPTLTYTHLHAHAQANTRLTYTHCPNMPSEACTRPTRQYIWLARTVYTHRI